MTTSPTKNIEEIKEGGRYYDHTVPVWQHVKEIQEQNAKLTKEKAALETRLHAQLKQNNKMKEEVFKLERTIEEFTAFIQKMRKWKHE